MVYYNAFNIFNICLVVVLLIEVPVDCFLFLSTHARTFRAMSMRSRGIWRCARLKKKFAQKNVGTAILL